MSQVTAPAEPLFKLFLRFLRFGGLAWGGPVAQIARFRQELVEEEKWVSNEQFNRILAVYQVLPGPEATEMCVYFGMQSRGRIGGLVAGSAFVLPGFLLMLLLSWVYVTYGIANPIFAGLFYGFQPAVAALIVRAVERIGRHAVTDRWLLAIAVLVGGLHLLETNFLITLGVGGLAYALIRRQKAAMGLALLAALVVGAVLWRLAFPVEVMVSQGVGGELTRPSLLTLLISGLKAGSLTFGGAYTAIPFLQRDAVEVGGWMTNETFLDGLALSGILPAPLIIFSTFAGYIGGGIVGAVVMTIGVFFPAFAITLIGHDYLERVINNPALHTFLEGVTAGVVGLIAATSLGLLATAVRDIPSLVIFVVALVILFRWKSKLNTPAVVIGAGLVGVAIQLVS